MPSVTCFNVRFTPSWLMIIIALFFISLFVRLGFWQIQRADEKKSMVAAEQALAKQPAIDWRSNQKPPLQYQRIKINGTYLPELFLLDNQHYQHQFGYDVISPLFLDDGRVVMIDRGWILGDRMRVHYPEISIPNGIINIEGIVYYPSKKQWVLGPGLEKKDDKLFIVEIIDAKLLEHLLQKKVYPFIIRLEKNNSHGFVREWAIVSMPPERHLAYAFQWFAMALVILIIFVALNLKKKE